MPPFLPRAKSFVFPGPRDRVTINGMTGSGKSTFALWLFSESADFDQKPWVLVDFKGEDNFNIILREHDAELIAVNKPPPKTPGIYVLHPEPTQMEAVIAWLWSVYKQGKIGLVFDEVSMIPEVRGEANSGGPFKAILTQGRSKEIPVYALAQRPVDVNRHVYTESNYYAAFRLRSRADFERVRDFVPEEDPVWNDNKRLPEYWSRWYDAQRDVSFFLRPAPPPKQSLDTISHRCAKMRRNEKL